MKCPRCGGKGVTRVVARTEMDICPKCHGKGEVTLTNFECITRSPEALASWLDEHAEFCAEISCDECYVKDECWKQGCNVDFCSNAKRWLNWLKQESMQESE